MLCSSSTIRMCDIVGVLKQESGKTLAAPKGQSFAQPGWRPRCYAQVGKPSIAILPRRAFDNSPAIYRWGWKSKANRISSVGTIEIRPRITPSIVPTGRKRIYHACLPSSKLLGYYRNVPTGQKTALFYTGNSNSKHVVLAFAPPRELAA